MINGTQITVVGNLGSDPELRYTPSGQPVCSLSVAVTPRKYDKEAGQWADGETTWYRVSAWRDLGEHAAESLIRGARVIVVGQLALREWESNGKSGSSLEVTADAIGPDLAFATAKVKRAERTTAGAGTARDEAPF